MQIDEIIARTKRTRLETYTESGDDSELEQNAASGSLHKKAKNSQSNHNLANADKTISSNPKQTKQPATKNKTNVKLVTVVDQLQRRVNELDTDVFSLIHQRP